MSAYVGLGSNLADPVRQIQRALRALPELPGIALAASSRFYSSRPLGPQDQPDYVNAVAKLRTGLEPLALLDVLQNLETEQGRTRSGDRWGPRTLDLDLLLYADRRIRETRLEVPHPGLTRREFVLYPLLEIAGPDLRIPGAGLLGDLVAACPRNGLEPLP